MSKDTVTRAREHRCPGHYPHEEIQPIRDGLDRATVACKQSLFLDELTGRMWRVVSDESRVPNLGRLAEYAKATNLNEISLKVLEKHSPRHLICVVDTCLLEYEMVSFTSTNGVAEMISPFDLTETMQALLWPVSD
jgi:hypothetical protein